MNPSYKGLSRAQNRFITLYIKLRLIVYLELFLLNLDVYALQIFSHNLPLDLKQAPKEVNDCVNNLAQPSTLVWDNYIIAWFSRNK